MTVVFPEDWHPLVAHVQANVYSKPQQAIEAARQLLKLCSSAEHIAYVYEKLGFAHLILGEHRLSCLYYEQARDLDPENIYILANLAHAQYELGEHVKAVHTGRKALRLKDKLACNTTPAPKSQLGKRHLGESNLISYSLYGNQPRYCEMAVLNVMAARHHLPDFVCRFYVDATPAVALLKRLEGLGAQCIHIDEKTKRMPATFWRFLAMDDPQADCVLVRDVDSLIDAKDAWCVRDWQQSRYDFHVIRDDCCHTELILAGLFGIRSGVVRDIQSHIDDFMQHNGSAVWERYADQLFLRHHIWPLVHRRTLAHDQIYSYGVHVHPLKFAPTEQTLPLNAFMGANHATCQIACTIENNVANTMPYVSLRDETGTLICRYMMQKDDTNAAPNHWRTQLPLSYMQALESGQWRYDIEVHPEGQVLQGEGSIDPQRLGFAPKLVAHKG